MDERNRYSGPWNVVLEEIRRLRRDLARGDEELWQAVDDLHGLVRASSTAKPSGPESQGREGEPGSGMDPLEYRRLKRRLWRFVAERVPDGSRVSVVSRGDGDLLDLPDMVTEHFPREIEGGYAGYYPPDGTPMIAHLEWVRAQGTTYLLFPATALWWFDSFPAFGEYLRRRYALHSRVEGIGWLFHLGETRRPSEIWVADLQASLDSPGASTNGGASILDWDTGLDLEARFPDATVFSPPVSTGPLPYLDHTVDVVAVSGDDAGRMAEARRVASRSLLRCPDPPHRDDEGDSVEAYDTRRTPTVEHLDGSPPPSVSVSVIIPTYNGYRHLEPCLRGIRSTLPAGLHGEVLVVDDGSGEKTTEVLRRWEAELPYLRVVRNPRNLGFIGACNRGAEEAEGEILVFLNDDTVPLEGWLRSLARTFQACPDAGVVGGMLLYPDGRLQEAGGVIFRDGSGANFGRGDYGVDGPLYGYRRRVHYCSGALLATPRKLFESLGGFDLRYRPAYYEDTDYCFSVRREGLAVYYQPEARVVHVEGASCGTDPSQGHKRHQLRNRDTFRRKWRRILKDHPESPSNYSPLTWHQLALVGDGS